MIPYRVKLAGFLSYKDEQTIRFDGAPVWMLAGTNGSGKSSIFDAVTYALFGHHRGGSQNAAELINKESNSLSVEFDFKLEGKYYRIKRTLRRSQKGSIAGTQQVFTLKDGANEDSDNWEAVPDTNKKVDFDKWIHEKIGLDYETFTSSVLLLQGKAEKLLDSKPSGRAEVLAGIVDLERYQRLYDRANAEKLTLKSKLEAISHQTQGVPEVSDMEFTAAALRIEEIEDDRKRLLAKLDQLADQEILARRWVDTQTRLTTARQRLAGAEVLVAEAVSIEKAHGRMVELRAVLPAVNAVVTTRTQFNESVRKVERLKTEQTEAAERKRKAETALDSQKRQRTLQQKQLQEAEDRARVVVERLRALSVQLQTVALVEQQEAQLKQFQQDLQKLPADPEKALQAAHEERDRLESLQRVLPILERVQTERHDLRQAGLTQRTANENLARIKAEGEAAKEKHTKTTAALAEARRVKSEAEQRLTVCKTILEQARAALAEFTSLSGAKTCRSCGQPLTPKHFAEEKAKREAEVAKAEKDVHDATKAVEKAGKTEQTQATAEKELADHLTFLRDQYKDATNEAKQATNDLQRLTQSLDLRYAEMPLDLQQKIAPQRPTDWLITTFPERDDLVHLRREIGGLDGIKRTLRETEETIRKVRDLQSRIDAATRTLTSLRANLPTGDLARLRQEHTSLQTEETTLTNNIKGTKLALETTDRQIDLHGREAHTATQSLTEITGKLNTETVTQKHCAETVERALKMLPASWKSPVEAAGLREHSVWQQELDTLEEKKTEARYKQLELARGGLVPIRGEIQALEAESEKFPDDARQTPEAVKALIQAARRELDQREEDLRSAHRERDKLAGFRETRAKLGEQFKLLDSTHNKYKILAELLGRDRLQRHLVRQAEKQIVDYANSVLDRLSGGQLYLKLVAGDDGSDRALDLECYNRVTGGAPINVTFLSGSQRFRVAVSLALAIGQYASRLHRPIESVIIDEGFGCLDRNGRQVMIQELQNLRGHLNCILLVSHQEEFADAFSDGYRFELRDGATHVTRFQK